MRITTLFCLFSALALLTGCGVNVSQPEVAPPTAVFVTATLPATALPQPSQTPLPPTPISTTSPIEGMTTTQVNVRAETSTASNTLGTIAQFSTVQIIGRDASSSWYQIIYAGAPNGVGWIRAEYVQLNNAAEEVPVIAGASGGGAGVSGLVIQKINVRSGPGITFDALGELNPNDVVFISGRDESGTWVQIEFSAAADGKGWAALEYLQVEGVDSLPVIGAEAPNPTSETTDTMPPISAMPDGDLREAPLAKINFSPMGMQKARIDGSVSSASGDTEDWVEFTSYNGSVAIQLLCSGEGLQVELIGEVVEHFNLACSEIRILNVAAGQAHLLRLLETGVNPIEYTLVMENSR